MTTILGIKVHNRVETAVYFQEIITLHGCVIKTRIGLHNIANGTCSPYGLILLEIPNNKSAIEVEKDLLNIEDVEIQKMVFDIV